jgi:acyl carrier protein
MLKQMEAILRDVFDEPGLVVSESTSPNDIKGWDSLGQISLILRLEEEFNVVFGTTELVHARSVGDLMTIVATKRATSADVASGGSVSDECWTPEVDGREGMRDQEDMLLQTWFGLRRPPSSAT